ncbi:hypothetical protein HMPREF9123_0775 [Neisseria bacilliformis ATCC BAA-1200]|uniref:Uncharacterized protein n=1 Tax=Neisseria bacilliformis ATCC BAA-1200 TaxID=888742 RepID=F2BAE3_9NEIS|nr:hypothetical protein HMPREF9123_0775 [Neisseria bacilliformis ATCC BAA-1200]
MRPPESAASAHQVGCVAPRRRTRSLPHNGGGRLKAQSKQQNRFSDGLQAVFTQTPVSQTKRKQTLTGAPL